MGTLLKLSYKLSFPGLPGGSCLWFHSYISLKKRPVTKSKGICAKSGGGWVARDVGTRVGFSQGLFQTSRNFQLPWGSLNNREINRKKNNSVVQDL